MSCVEEHYESLLAPVYTWLAGGYEESVEKNLALFRRHGITPRGSGIAADLGCGPGFQAVALARLGFSVTAVDLSATLLAELQRSAGGLPIVAVRDDLLRFDDHLSAKPELVVCMGDTLTHLESGERVNALFDRVAACLEPGGRLVLSFRDLGAEMFGLDRFVQLRSDESRIFTCFLEFREDRVLVHDLLHEKRGSGWVLSKSVYPKLRLSRKEVVDCLESRGFVQDCVDTEGGMITIRASPAGRGIWPSAPSFVKI